MKKFLLLFAGIIMMSFVLAQANLDETSLKVSLVNQEPDPVGPGEYVDVRIKVENLGANAVQGVILEVVPEFPFTIDSQTPVIDIGTVQAFQNNEGSFIAKYKLRVSDDAIEGSNDLKVRVMTAGTKWAYYTFAVNVRTTDANLAIDSVLTTPETVEPGKDATVQITVKNLADSTLKDISINLDLTLSSLGAADLDSLPFATLDSGTEKRIRQLSPGDEAKFTYKLRAYPDAASKVYKIPLQVEYKDELNTQYSTSSLIGIVVNSAPDVTAVLDSTTVQEAGSKGTATLKIINKGLTNIKFVDIILKPSNEFDLLSEGEVYMGNIDSDDYETADFDIYVNDVAGKVILPVHYEYMDANNNKYTVEKSIEMKLYSKDDLKKLNTATGPSKNMIIFVAVIVIAVLSFIIWRIYRRCRR
jgi:hypothetical protein